LLRGRGRESAVDLGAHHLALVAGWSTRVLSSAHGAVHAAAVIDEFI
jgi:hypothetical protein